VTVMPALRRLPALLVAALITACATTGTAYQDSAEVLLLGIQPLATDQPQHFELMLGIRNPNAVALVLEGLSYRVAINDREFAYGASRQTVSIPAHHEAVIDVEVDSARLAGLRLSPPSGADTPHSLAYRLTGELALAEGAARLPFDTSGTLDWQPATGAAAR